MYIIILFHYLEVTISAREDKIDETSWRKTDTHCVLPSQNVNYTGADNFLIFI